MRRLLSDAVQVKPPITMSAILSAPGETSPETLFRENLPTESEMRDAMMKLAASLREMVTARTAGQEGWSVGDMEVQILNLDEGETVLRGQVVIERTD